MNEEYQAVVNFDQGKATAQEKIARWHDLKIQEDERKTANLENLYQGMIELDQKQKKKRDEDSQIIAIVELRDCE